MKHVVKLTIIFKPQYGLEVTMWIVAVNLNSPTAGVIYRWALWPQLRLSATDPLRLKWLQLSCHYTLWCLKLRFSFLWHAECTHSMTVDTSKHTSQLPIRPYLHMLSYY